MIKQIQDWKVGDKFTTPATGDIVFTVIRCGLNYVDARDGLSRSRVSSFAKWYIIPH